MKFKTIKGLSQTFVDYETKNQYHVPGARPQSSSMAIAIGTFAAVGGFLYGYDTGLSNNVLSMHYVVTHFSKNGTSFSAIERAIATASLSLGTLVGAIFSPLLTDALGRKMAILISSLVVFNIGNICQISSTTLALLCVGRVITGCGIGILSATVPLYQSEASPKWVRGAIVSTYQWAITWGLLCSSAISQATYKMNNTGSYRIPIGLQSGWAILLSIGVFFLPESPRFYVMKNRISDAAHSLSILRRVPEDDPGLIEELVDIKANYDFTMSLSAYSFIDCFRSGPGRSKQGLRMVTGIVLQGLQQASGINFIFYYGVWFFVETGVVDKSYLYSFVTYAVNVVGTVPGIFLIELIGRRKSLMFGAIGMTISSFIIAIVGTAQGSSITTNKVMLAFVCTFILFFASTWGPGVWVVTSEIFPLGIRGRAVSLSAATNWLVNFAFAFSTPYLIDGNAKSDTSISLGMKIFFLWGGVTTFAAIFTYFAIYETKGLKLEEIDDMYSSCKSAKDSVNFVPKSDVDYDNESCERIRYAITNEVGNYNHEDHDLADLPRGAGENKYVSSGSGTVIGNDDSAKPSGFVESLRLTGSHNPSDVENYGHTNQSSDGNNNLLSDSSTIMRSATDSHHAMANNEPQPLANLTSSESSANWVHSSDNDTGSRDMVNYGFLRTDIAPSISTGSDSASSVSDADMQFAASQDLREYVNNIQSRQFEQYNGSNDNHEAGPERRHEYLSNLNIELTENDSGEESTSDISSNEGD
ncbi:glucose sensor [Saccharomycopsis crataegensis]|uniref:Glucose sensor n=1 Tax=Saccharomycopsis crataegensis TaxID=43959 RepID=A0AAV5QQ39_9ASCO|nr:glucose sensor [Saccharomycopsis crataegensis]